VQPWERLNFAKPQMATILHKEVVVAVIKKSLLKLNHHSGNPRNDVVVLRDNQYGKKSKIGVNLNLTAFLKDKEIPKALPISLQSLTAAALILPGLLQPVANAEDDSIDFQYTHYQEGSRGSVNIPSNGIADVRDKRNPIEVDSLHGSTKIALTDRIKFAFNYAQDTWSGATPWGSAPESSGSFRIKNDNTNTDSPPIYTGASPWSGGSTYLNKDLKPVYLVNDPVTGQSSVLKDRTVHVMSYASPETRKQGDFKLSYEWYEAALELGGGISLERDYESRFVNLGGRMDFNQKLTTLNLGLSYTNSTIDAVLDSVGDAYFTWGEQHKNLIDYNIKSQLNTLRGNRQDWSAHLGLSQVINKNALAELGMGYTRSTGFLENPYKISWLYGVDTNNPTQGQFLPDSIVVGGGQAFIEQRPDVRNQWNWTARWVQYVEQMDAALHLDYQFATDDWDINAHTFSADWVQPLVNGWAVIPRVRYYSQEAADFYKPFFVVNATNPTGFGLVHELPENFSSDQRLSGYGTLSGGVTVSKEFAKGIRLETGFEYYTHQGSLKLGGGGEEDFADFDYWVANAALKVNLSALGQGGSGGEHHASHHAHSNIPSGVLFGHTLDKAGDMMVGYRYMHSQQAGDFLHGDKEVSEQQIIANGCPGRGDVNLDGIVDGCSLLPIEMTMNMHMLDLIYAPTDWLTLMLMPQFMDMDMPLYQPESLNNDGGHGHGGGIHLHETGGIGDTGMYAIVKLFDTPRHHLHITTGFSVPTGDVGIKLKEGSKNLDGGYIHYGMQLGSGTWDLKPSLTYTGKADAWSWGGQAGGTKRLEDSNKSGYALGDLFETSVWSGYDLTHWLTASVRATYTWQGSIKGQYPRGRRDDKATQCNRPDFISSDDLDGDGLGDGPAYFHQALFNDCLAQSSKEKNTLDAEDRPTPMDAPRNYGGHYVDIGFGLSATVPSGSLAGNKLSFEWLQPVYTDVNGYQLDRDGALSFTWSYGF
jgi:hypothetical protein